MEANRITSRRPLKPFKHFLPEHLSHIRKAKGRGQALKEESIEGNIADAVSLVIDGPLTNDEREKAIHSFIKELDAMRGERIVAIAVASD